MIRVNLLNKAPNMWKKTISLLPYIAIPIALALGAHAWGQRSHIKRLEKRVESLYDQREADHLKWMEKFLEFEAKIVGKIEQGKEASKVIKIDVGKTIKEFNRDVKATKEIDSAPDSAAALHDAWNK